MIELKNVSKFYYQNGMIASGFSKINLKFNIGEFVVITGESGSGKSTLLNVISGLDTYEEGEMYINGEETSHYTETDFEDYRRKYIGNIFQNFNLVNSYTVYQNVELVLLLNGEKKKNIKSKVLDIINTVGLTAFKNTKVSKLSGGQKQRVAIARALAKETPIIVADEPTGNLDTVSAKQIMKLLHDISKNKLVIIVTHNKEQAEEYATRLIHMHDGKVLEDKVITKVSDTIKDEKTYKNITIPNRFRLGIRNTFNIFSKFILILFVFFFISETLLFEYTSFKKSGKEFELTGSNMVFTNHDTKRIVLKKKDLSSISDEELETLKNMEHVTKVYENDALLDTSIYVQDDEYRYIDGFISTTDSFSGELTYGRMPTNDYEIIVKASYYNWYLTEEVDSILNSKFKLNTQFGGNDDIIVTIVGVQVTNNITDENNIFYLSDAILDKFRFRINESYSDAKTLFEGKYYDSYAYSYHITPAPYVPRGSAFISEDMEYLCKDYNCINRPLKISVSNIYYNTELDLKVTKTYNQKNYKNVVGVSNNFEDINTSIFINVDEYNKLFNKATYQSSIFVDNEDNIPDVLSKLDNLGYTSLAIKDTIINEGRNVAIVLRIISTIVTVMLVVALFFISYFVIRIILKSRSIYFTTIRILGSTKSIAKQILDIELFTNATLAYLINLLIVYLVKINVIKITSISDLLPYIGIKEIILIYLILIIMSQLISNRFARKIFTKSVMKTIGEER